MPRFLILLLTCLTLSIAFDAPATAAIPKRTSKNVKQERRAKAGEIEQTRKKITQNTAETRRQLNKLESLTAESKRRNEAIAALKKRISALDSQIKAIDDTIAGLEKDIATLRSAYAENLRAMRARRQQMNSLALIFSARNFTEAYKRYRYLQEFDRWQKHKTVQIANMADEITLRRQHVADVRKQQSTNLAKLSDETAKLQTTCAETETLVANLKKQGSSLNKALAEKQQQLKNLDAELDRIIAREAEEARKAEEAARLAAEKKREEEARRAAEEAKKNNEVANSQDSTKNAGAKTAKSTKDSEQRNKKGQAKNNFETGNPTTTKNVDNAVSNIALTGSFTDNKGKMPFPVTGKRSIISHFGLNSHPDISNVQINNSGIDIEAEPGASARAVFDGEVSSVFRVSGYHNVVMLRHGNYLTVYAGLDALTVKKGDKVKAGQSIGKVYSDPDDENRTILHFEVRKERAKLNPEEWVK